MKTSFHEGGVRGAAAIWSPLFARRNYVSDELFHITDWLPTFVSAAGEFHPFLRIYYVSRYQLWIMLSSVFKGGDSGAIENIDGINQWNLLTGKQQKSNRKEVLVNVNFERNSSAIISGNWKLIKRK